MPNRIVRCSRAAAAFVSIVLFAQLASAATDTWVQLNLKSHPSARVNAPMAYDPSAKDLVLFGGYDGSTYKNDTWIFKNKTWVQLNPPVAPPARTAAAMSYDVQLKKIVMFGGFNGSQYLGDTWIWDGAAQTWTQANPTAKPTPVTLPMMFTDPLNGHAEMVGGYDGMFYQDITWQWTGTNWKKRNPATWITARGAAVVANDLAHRKVVIFGGLADVNPVNTWTWDGITWTEESPSMQPPWSFYTPATYDPQLGEVIMFSGSSGTNDTWVWTGSDWTMLTTQQTPTARDSHSMAYDYASQQLIMFGGESSTTLFGTTYLLVVH